MPTKMKFKNGLASSTAIPSVSPGNTNVKAKRTTKALQTLPFTRVSREDVADDERLSRIIQDLQKRINSLTLPSRTSPESECVYFQKVTTTSGTGFTLVHNLQRPPTGYTITRAYAGSAACQLVDGALPPGYDASIAVNLVPSGTGTYDIKIF